jgi:hypothetical protein
VKSPEQDQPEKVLDSVLDTYTGMSFVWLLMNV